MNNFELLKKKTLYRSKHRGTKEMDILLSSFVKKYINRFNIAELKQLDNLLKIDDDILFNWYFNKNDKVKIPNSKVSKLLKNFKT